MSLLKPRSATIVLYQGDDMNTLAELKRAADQATGGNRNDAGAEETAAYNAFLAETTQRAVEVVVQSIGRRRWRDLVVAHPPRMVPQEMDPPAEGETVVVPPLVEHDEDVQWGVNTETFPRALLTYTDGDYRTLAKPSFTDEAEVAAFVDDEVTEGDFERLWIAAFALNAQPSRDPKALGQSSSESTT